MTPDDMTSTRTAPRPISSIEVDARDPNLRSIKVNGRTVARLSASDVQQLRLRAGMDWSASLQAMVAATVQAAKARALALAMLARRALSSAEVVDRLQRKGISSSLAEQIARQLERDRWIDDELLARQVVESAMSRGPVASQALLDRLERRGIASSLAADVVKESLRRADPGADAAAMANRLARSNSKGGPQAVARRVAAALSRRGFDADAIDEALRAAGLMPEGD
jgi:SOS response regulatory protein OraA/RecX